MANSYIVIQDVTRELLSLFVGNLQAVKSVNKGYDSSFGKVGRKIGESLSVRLPNKFVVGTGAAVTPTDYTDSVVPVVLNTQKNCSIEITSRDLQLSFDDFSDRFIKPAAARLAAEVEKDLITTMAQSAFNQVGTPGTPIADTGIFFDALARLQEFLVPYDDIMALVSPKGYARAGKLMLNLFTPVTNEKVQVGSLGHAFGADWYVSQYLYTQATGAYSGTPLVNGANQTGSVLALDGFGINITGAIKKGDIISLTGVNFTNPLTGVATTTTAQFVATADANSNGTGQVNVSIYPAIVTSGAYKNVSASPADNAAVTIAGAAGSSYQTSLMFHRDAAVFVSAPLDTMGALPSNTFTEVDESSGIAITCEIYRDGRSGSTVIRADVLYGTSPLRREAMCRMVVEG